jgi:hypothetical protein
MKFTVGRLPSKWPEDTEVAWKYIPALDELTDDNSLQDARLAWFGNSYTMPDSLKISARKVAIDTSARIRNTYTLPALKAWAKTWKSKYEVSPDYRDSRGTGTKYLLTNAPAMLNICSTSIASLIVALSAPATRTAGIDKIKKPTIKVKAVKIPESMTAGLSAKAKKKKLKELKKFQRYSGTITIKDTSGKPIKEMPVKILWKNAKKKTVKSQNLWTDKKGKVVSTLTIKKPKKNTKMILSVSVPTSNIKTYTSKKFTVKKK